MSELQLFNFEQLPVRTIDVEGEPHFVGKDVAEILGYSNTRDALIRHVDSEDKVVVKLDTPGGMQGQVVINESGLYSMIIEAAKQSVNPQIKETARKFKRFITSEVLPAIRKTGGYQKLPTSPMEILELVFQEQKNTKEEVMQIKSDVIDLKENQKLSPGEYGHLTKTINKKVMQIKELHKLYATTDDQQRLVHNELYKDINHEVFKACRVNQRTQIRQKDSEAALDIVYNWTPSRATLKVIQDIMNQEAVI
ncbi:phage repressor protein [Macrococcus equipercicus]|uniref:Phage repressor protein n=1 Tax=Macrococcus equipercicus TaxID=69967 RepID=A0ABQ6R7T8_9STAP|nr:BRO family protein [Macrococcus equipercicus]KAA1039148.1 phage repressor protein [Macrococcus equipercicus]